MSRGAPVVYFSGNVRCRKSPNAPLANNSRATIGAMAVEFMLTPQNAMRSGATPTWKRKQTYNEAYFFFNCGLAEPPICRDAADGVRFAQDKRAELPRSPSLANGWRCRTATCKRVYRCGSPMTEKLHGVLSKI